MAKTKKEAAYRALHSAGTLRRRADEARALLAPCRVCPRRCGVDRLQGELGVCRIGARARVASYGPHFGEESPLVGENGSGAIFFSGCNLLCVFCQNEEISHADTLGDSAPDAATGDQLAAVMLDLQQRGCHNINLVTPSHVVPQILEGLAIAAESLRIPLVYNTSGYDSVETLHLLDGIVDIYMPDVKFWSDEVAARYTGVKDYATVVRAAVREMHRQVGDLELDSRGLATRGLLVRHLVMPGRLDETGEIMRFLAGEISPATYVNIMDQYHPCARAADYPEINRPLTADEYHQARELARQAGLHRLDERDWSSLFRRLGL
ncbi:MAG TPA: radical SAM protein [Desulfobulbus sp.]|nr:radical SAM protein [Desulfobulbus sp.]